MPPPLNTTKTSALLLSFLELGFVQLAARIGRKFGGLAHSAVYGTTVLWPASVYEKTVAPCAAVR
jgi:hypothetical protein